MTQRVTIAGIIGEMAIAVDELFWSWRHASLTRDIPELDSFCERLKAHSLELSIAYYCEWLDRWLMGDCIPGLNSVEGNKFQAACYHPHEALEHADNIGTQFLEQEWLAARIREATEVCGRYSQLAVILIIREVIDGSASDEDILAACKELPEWVSDLGNTNS